MKTKMFKIAAIFLLLAGSFSSCGWPESTKNLDYGKKIPPCHPCDLSCKPYFGIPPWVDKEIFEWMENEIYGRIFMCDYKDGRGFLLEQFENSIDEPVYSFRSCDGTVLYEEEKNSIEDTYPELNIKNKRLLMRKFPLCWEEEETPNEFLCDVINPFTLPQVKEFTYRCEVRNCPKTVSICTYKNGVGYFLKEHILMPSAQPHYEFLDCYGDLLCQTEERMKHHGILFNKTEGINQLCPELYIDLSTEKIILELYISLNVKYLNQ